MSTRHRHGRGAGEDKDGQPGRDATGVTCRGTTRRGARCRRRVVSWPGVDGFCRQHTVEATAPTATVWAGESGPTDRQEGFYARVLSTSERAAYLEALTQDGLVGEVALLRLYLLRLLRSDDPTQAGELPRAISTLARVLRQAHDTAQTVEETLDALVRAEGQRLLTMDHGEDECAREGEE